MHLEDVLNRSPTQRHTQIERGTCTLWWHRSASRTVCAPALQTAQEQSEECGETGVLEYFEHYPKIELSLTLTDLFTWDILNFIRGMLDMQKLKKISMFKTDLILTNSLSDMSSHQDLHLLNRKPLQHPLRGLTWKGAVKSFASYCSWISCLEISKGIHVNACLQDIW